MYKFKRENPLEMRYKIIHTYKQMPLSRYQIFENCRHLYPKETIAFRNELRDF